MKSFYCVCLKSIISQFVPLRDVRKFDQIREFNKIAENYLNSKIIETTWSGNCAERISVNKKIVFLLAGWHHSMIDMKKEKQKKINLFLKCRDLKQN